MPKEKFDRSKPHLNIGSIGQPTNNNCLEICVPKEHIIQSKFDVRSIRKLDQVYIQTRKEINKLNENSIQTTGSEK